MSEKRTSTFIVALIFLTAALYILSIFGSNVAQAATPTGIITGKAVNVRPDPSTSNPQIGTLLQGSKVEILTHVGTWYNIKFGSLTGWVHQDYITTGSSSAAVNQSVQQSQTPMVILDGAPLAFDVPPVIENGRILVPLAAIFRSMGAAVEWNASTQTVTAVRGTTTVILPINSNTPTVNGTVWKLDVPARIVGNRTLAPLRFVGEALGGTVSWDGADFKAIMTSPPALPSSNNAAVVAVNIINTVNLRSSAEINDDNVIGQASPGETLTVLSQYGDWYLVRKGSLNAWVAGWVVELIHEGEVVPPSAETPEADPAEDKGSDPPAANPAPGSSDLASITLSSERAAEGLEISIESTVKLNMKKSENNGRLTYTFKDSQIIGTTSFEKWLGTEKLNVQGTNTGGDAQVVITMPTGVTYETSLANSDKKAVLFIPNYISSVDRSTFSSSGENITVKGIAALGYTSDVGEKKLEIVINNAIQGKAQSSYSYSSSLISSMTFAPQGNGETATVMTINTKKPVKFSVGPNDDGSAINILFIDKSEIESREPLVVLDAGHGGKDPGANGCNLDEKDVNLAVALKVGEILKKNGIRVVYTRTNDTFVELDDRPNIANMYNASVFVSIHCNSNVSSSPSGTETYCYYPLSNPQLFMQKDERYNLALRIQQAMVKELGLNDRGVKQANFAVLRETEMPSALVEMGFISNPTEGALLGQNSCRNKAAEAIAAAIADYMESYL